MEDGKENCEVLTPGHNMAIAYISSHSNCGYLQDTCTQVNQSQYWSEKGSQNPSEGALGHLVATKGGRTVFLLGDVVTDRLPTPQWMVPYCAQMHSTSWAHVVVNNKDKYDDNEDMRLGERWGSEFWDIEGINGVGVNDQNTLHTGLKLAKNKHKYFKIYVLHMF